MKHAEVVKLNRWLNKQDEVRLIDEMARRLYSYRETVEAVAVDVSRVAAVSYPTAYAWVHGVSMSLRGLAIAAIALRTPIPAETTPATDFVSEILSEYKPK